MDIEHDFLSFINVQKLKSDRRIIPQMALTVSSYMIMMNNEFNVKFKNPQNIFNYEIEINRKNFSEKLSAQVLSHDQRIFGPVL